MGFIVAGCGGSLRFGRAEYKLQHAPCRIVHAALRQTSTPDCREDFLFHIGAAAGHIQIAACAEARNPVIHRPQSVTTIPSKPHSVRSISVSSSLLSEQ